VKGERRNWNPKDVQGHNFVTALEGLVFEQRKKTEEKRDKESVKIHGESRDKRKTRGGGGETAEGRRGREPGTNSKGKKNPSGKGEEDPRFKADSWRGNAQNK